jgi:hypothetical protein
VQQEADNARPFALDVAKSAGNPANPVSHLGNTTQPFYLGFVGIDPELTRSEKNFTFQWSYGDPQKVRVTAKRSLGAVLVKYRINGGRCRAPRRPNGPAASGSDRKGPSTTA